MNFDAAALAYVRYVLEEKNLKPGALALKAGISASTLTRALSDPNHKFKLSMTTLQKISDFSGVNPAPFLEAKDSADLTLSAAHRPDFYMLGSSNEVLNRTKFKVTLLIGDVAAGQWREPTPFNYFDYGPLHITSTSYSPQDCFGYVMRDDSANMIAQNGDILFCTKIDPAKADEIETGRMPRGVGGPVIVERRSKDAFKIEVTLRVIRPRRDRKPGWELLSAHQEDYDENKKKRPKIARVSLDRFVGNEEIKIIGQVELIIRGDTTDAVNWLTLDTP